MSFSLRRAAALATVIVLSACQNQDVLTAPRLSPTAATRNVNPAGCVPTLPGLVAWFNGEGNANDSYGTHTANAQNMTYAPGMVGQAFRYDGTGTVTIAAAGDLPHANQPRTYMMWVFVEPGTWGGDVHTILQTGNEGDTFSFDMEPYPTIQFYTWHQDANGIQTGLPQSGGWMHLAATYDGFTTVIYVQGHPAITYHPSINTALTDIHLGYAGISNIFAPYLGLIDEFTVFNRALTASEVLSINNARSAGMCAPNHAPTVSVPAAVNAAEGAPVTITATGADADNDALTYTFHTDDGAADVVNTTGTLSVTYPDVSTHTVNVTVSDGNGGTATGSTTVNVANAVPVIASINDASTVNVGGTFTLAGTFSDAGVNDGPWTATINWGDQSAPSVVTLNAQGAYSAPHVYSGYGSYTASVTITDKNNGVSDAKTVSLSTSDITAPVVTYAVEAVPTSGWYTNDVHVTWTVTDPESGVSTATGCGPTNITQDTGANGVTVTCTATNGAGLKTVVTSLPIKRDASKPVITYAVDPVPASGWYTGDVHVTWTATDPQSGIASSTGCAPIIISQDTGPNGVAVTCTAQNGAGGSNSSATLTIKRDATKPAVNFTGATAYTVDQTVAITCTASDVGGSGVASPSCGTTAGAAYTFTTGNNTVSTSVTDIAGNTTNASVTFTVGVTQNSLCALVTRWVSNGGIANSMCVKISHGTYGALRNELSAQSGKAISDANAATLLRLINDIDR